MSESKRNHTSSEEESVREEIERRRSERLAESIRRYFGVEE